MVIGGVTLKGGIFEKREMNKEGDNRERYNCGRGPQEFIINGGVI